MKSSFSSVERIYAANATSRSTAFSVCRILRKHFRTVLLFVLLSVWSFFSFPACAQSSGKSVRFKGTANYINGFSGDTKDFVFEGLVSTDHWRIKIFPTGHENEFGHVEYGFDGTNQFFLQFVNDEPYRIANTTSSVFINSSVVADHIPASLTSFIHVYWLAYDLCSTEPDGDRPSVLPVSMLSGSGYTNLFAVDYVTSPKGLVDRVDILNPGLIYGTSGKTYPQPAPYDQGFVMARFNVTERKSIDGLSLPMNCEWTVFTPSKNGQSKSDLRTIHQLVLRTRSVESYDNEFSAMPSPPFGQKMVVKDYRLATMVNDSDVLYFSTNGFWNPEDGKFKKRVSEILGLNNQFWTRELVLKIALIGFLVLAGFTAVLILERSN